MHAGNVPTELKTYQLLAKYKINRVTTHNVDTFIENIVTKSTDLVKKSLTTYEKTAMTNARYFHSDHVKI